MVTVYTRYDAREKLFKPTLHSNYVLPVYYKDRYCVRGALFVCSPWVKTKNLIYENNQINKGMIGNTT